MIKKEIIKKIRHYEEYRKNFELDKKEDSSNFVADFGIELCQGFISSLNDILYKRK